MKREKDRLYLTEKELTTSAPLMKNLGIKLPTEKTTFKVSLNEVVKDDIAI
jgi:hypothetical protein